MFHPIFHPDIHAGLPNDFIPFTPNGLAHYTVQCGKDHCALRNHPLHALAVMSSHTVSIASSNDNKANGNKISVSRQRKCPYGVKEWKAEDGCMTNCYLIRFAQWNITLAQTSGVYFHMSFLSSTLSFSHSTTRLLMFTALYVVHSFPI